METKTLHEKLIAIQSELKAPKSQTNAFGKYKYRSCEDILEAVKPLLNEHGLTLTLSDEIVNIGTRYYVRAYAELSSGEQKNCVMALAREEEEKRGMDGSQITGAASSYARKYALNGLFLIDDTKDSDATNDHGKGEKNIGNPKYTDGIAVLAKTEAPSETFRAVMSKPPASKPSKPSLLFVLDILRAADSRAKLDALHTNALKYHWTEGNLNTINSRYQTESKKFPATDVGMETISSPHA